MTKLYIFCWFVGLVPLQVEHCDTPSVVKSDQGDLDDETEEISKSESIVPLLTNEHLAKLYVFALIWGMGAFLESEDRRKYDIFLKENLELLSLPKNKAKHPDVNLHKTMFDIVQLIM